MLVLLAGATCFVCYHATRRLTWGTQRLTLQRGMFGYDINKKGTPAGDVRVPEAAGLAPAAVFLASLTVLQVAHMWLVGRGAKEWGGGAQQRAGHHRIRRVPGLRRTTPWNCRGARR